MSAKDGTLSINSFFLMMRNDKASFNPIHTHAVYGPERICFQTARRPSRDEPVDPHHCLGRGGRDEESRETHSSVLNLAWLKRSVQNGPLINDQDQRAVYLRVAHEKVMQAVGQGRYELTKQDHQFIALIREKYPEYSHLYP